MLGRDAYMGFVLLQYYHCTSEDKEASKEEVKQKKKRPRTHDITRSLIFLFCTVCMLCVLTNETKETKCVNCVFNVQSTLCIVNISLLSILGTLCNILFKAQFIMYRKNTFFNFGIQHTWSNVPAK
jgi:small-conductance mechanosensitive channel